MARAFRVVDVFGFSGLMSGACSCTTDALVRGATSSLKSTVCFCPSPAGYRVVLLRFELVRLGFHRIRAWLELRKTEPPRSSVFTDRSEAILGIRDSHRGAGNSRAGRIAYRPNDGARRLALRPCGERSPTARRKRHQLERQDQTHLGMPKYTRL